MRKSDIVYIVSGIFAAASAFFYSCTMFFSIRLPRYYPVEHCWKWGKTQNSISQGWYGMQVFAYLAAGVVALMLYIIIRYSLPKDVKLKANASRLLGAFIVCVITASMAYVLYHEFAKWGIF